MPHDTRHTTTYMKTKDLIKHLDSFAPYAYQESYDNSGLIVGNPEDEIKGILVSLDVTEKVIDEAIQHHCNVIVSHHPILFKAIKKLTGSNYVERVIIKAIQHNINLISYHTNLDHMPNGVNGIIAEKLGLKNTRILAPKAEILKKLYTFCPVSHAEKVRNTLFEAGAGTIGNYDACSFNTPGTGTFRANEIAQPFVGKTGELHPEEEIKIEVIFPFHKEKAVIKSLLLAHPYEEVAYDILSLNNTHPHIGAGMIGELEKEMEISAFFTSLKETFHIPAIKHSKTNTSKIKTVAVCGGSGFFLLNQAITQQADVFITSDVKYHEFFDADEKIILADIGHYESEQYTKELILTILNQKFSKFAIRLTETDTNSVNYFI